jgi:hypothetical protein
MPRIRNFALPPELAEELLEVVKDLAPEVVQEWGRAVLPGGFTKPEMVRERMLARFTGATSIDPISLDMLSCEAPYRETISALTLPALQNLFVSCCILAGPRTWFLSLLLDPRDEVFKWAVEMASKPIPDAVATQEESAMAEDLLRGFAEINLFEPFGLCLSEPMPADVPPSPVLDDLISKTLGNVVKENQGRKARIDQLTHDLQQQKQKYQAKLKEVSDTAEREKKNFHAQLAGNREHVQKLLKEKQTLEDKVAEAERQRDSSIAQRVLEETSSALRKWLEAPRAVESVVGQSAEQAANLEARASQLLEAQARQDRHTGNRLELEKRQRQLLGLRERVNDALQNAIVPLHELKSLLSDLDAELERIQNVLSPGKVRSETASRLLTSVNTVSGWDELRALSQLLEQLVDATIIAPAEARELYGAVQRKFSLLAENTKQKAGEPDTGWSLREVLFRNKPALLILDGHNLLFNLTDLFELYFEEGHPGRKARQRLVELAGKLTRSRPNVQTKVCFDGPVNSSERVAPNLEVVYSGGSGANRADELIVAHLQFKDLKSLDQKVFVVTDDREIRKQILQTGAKFVRNDLFAVFLRDFGALSQP